MSAPRYQELADSLRQAFPAPVSDAVHDGYFVFSLLRALDQVDALKSQSPVLGEPRDPDFAAAAQAALERAPLPLEQVIPQLVACLRGMPIWAHPRSQVNVVAPPSIASIIGVVLPSIFNPNLCTEESGRGFSEAEVRVTAMAARLVGYDPLTAGGLFTFGGTGTLLYGLKIGLERALPGCLNEGLHNASPVILASEHSHYACRSVASWLGIGQDNVTLVPTHDDNTVQLALFEQALRQNLAAGRPVAAIVATMGTTDAFGLDDLAGLHEIRNRLAREFQLSYLPHLHADSVIGWAWSVFNDYDFSVNPLGFRGRTLRSLAAVQQRVGQLPLADSLGIDFHKTGFAPYISSLFLLRDRNAFQHLVRKRGAMPYLYHQGSYHPGMYTLETSRSAAGPMAALASLLRLGREGMQCLIGHAVEMAELLREQISARPEMTVVNPHNCGAVTLFRVYPDDVDTFTIFDLEQHNANYRERTLAHNDFNRRVFQKMQTKALAGQGVALGFTECFRHTSYGEPLVAIKSYVLSPFANAERMEEIVFQVLAARTEALAEYPSNRSSPAD